MRERIDRGRRWAGMVWRHSRQIRRTVVPIVAGMVGAVLFAAPANADIVYPHRGEGVISMTQRTCGTAAQWRANAAANAITSPRYLVLYGRGYDITCDGTHTSERASRTVTRAASAVGWVHPLASGRQGSGGGCFGVWRGDHYHQGVDMGAASGTPIRAASAGTVLRAGWRGGYGNAVEVSHGAGVSTLYAHASRIAVWSGAVQAGQTIAYVGSTGRSSGPHLHLEVRLSGAATSPGPWLRARGVNVGC